MRGINRTTTAVTRAVAWRSTMQRHIDSYRQEFSSPQIHLVSALFISKYAATVFANLCLRGSVSSHRSSLLHFRFDSIVVSVLQKSRHTWDMADTFTSPRPESRLSYSLPDVVLRRHRPSNVQTSKMLDCFMVLHRYRLLGSQTPKQSPLLVGTKNDSD